MSYRRSRVILVAFLALVCPIGARAASAQESGPAGVDSQLGEPFDAASLETAIKGMRVFKAKMADVAALAAQHEDLRSKQAALLESKRSEIGDYELSRQKIGECLRSLNESRSGNRQAQVQKKVLSIENDQPALQKFSLEFARLSQLVRDATSKGDSAEVKRLNADITTLLTVDAKADSIAGFKKCGAIPPKPAAVADYDQLQTRADALHQQLRAAESAADAEAARAVGVAPARFTRMRERLEKYIMDEKAFGETESAVLTPRRTEIQALLPSGSE